MLVSFTHLVLRSACPTNWTEIDVHRALSSLEGGSSDWPVTGPFQVGAVVERRTPAQISLMFGPEFAVALAGLVPGQWSEPIASRLGQHLVRVDRVEPTRAHAA
jgi:hypothetical protein